MRCPSFLIFTAVIFNAARLADVGRLLLVFLEIYYDAIAPYGGRDAREHLLTQSARALLLF